MMRRIFPALTLALMAAPAFAEGAWSLNAIEKRDVCQRYTVGKGIVRTWCRNTSSSSDMKAHGDRAACESAGLSLARAMAREGSEIIMICANKETGEVTFP